ncbi:sterol desaturase family protein [Arundinibacter roseus]|uniref:Sterol desaturase family protein n=1 Tax=Arundinibacter roseus TaxID=2070510 RepID=A0A4R4K9L8_9BACT|nr:sterol desaturase family protein [Arundinibacter roseus]TDB64517.1 sterol desaturase family protein [Arundinibacter roseus]
MKTVDFSEPGTFLLTAAFMFLGIFGRYVAIALLFSVLVQGVYKDKFSPRQVQKRPRRDRQTQVEIGWSFFTSILFALAGAAMVLVWQKGFTKVYLEVNEYPLWWLPVSLIIVLFLHETYYYWLHRWMHRPSIYKYVHKVHHDSITTSAWTSFSFHPLESILQAIFIPGLLFILPLHLYTIGLVLLIMTTTSVINHLNTELYPQDFHTHWFGHWWIGATHHSLHHSQFRTNFGLYFTFWDKWMKTESPQYARLFEEKTENSISSIEKIEMKIH